MTEDTTSKRYYLDHASTSPLRPEAVTALESWATSGPFGDPSRVHYNGFEVRAKIETAREAVASLTGVKSRQVVFTSGGTEAISQATFGALAKNPGGSVVAAGVEHSAVRHAAINFGELFNSRLVEAIVDDKGRIEPESIKDAIEMETKSGRSVALVNCQWANHEVGTLQDIEAIASICNSHQVPLHVDAVSAIGHVPIDLKEAGIDALSISAHKIGGPPGVGALILGRSSRYPPLIRGGDQERARRAGMENVPGIISFGAVAQVLSSPGWIEAQSQQSRRQTEEIISSLTSDESVIFYGDRKNRVPHIACFGIEGVEAEPILLGLDKFGISCHSGSACSSEALEPSPVLNAMGVEPDHSLRFSVGWSTTDEDIKVLLDKFPVVLKRLRELVS
ncbi:MAG: cysteine desulfurase [Acidimicrobiales bacterium]|nr:cysteine desulfurase [Acidimicrobiales bacterium]